MLSKMRGMSPWGCPPGAGCCGQPRFIWFGARSRTRTGTAARPRDFKSLASTCFAIRAAGAGAGMVAR